MLDSAKINKGNIEVNTREEILDKSPISSQQSFEALVTQGDEPEQRKPEIKLKQVAQTLRYKFGDKERDLPMIVNASLGEEETEQLLVVLRSTQNPWGTL